MGSYLITGRQGSGKTTICKLLQDLGCTAYDIDHTVGLAKLRDRTNNKMYSWDELPNFNPGDTIDWNRYVYEVQPNKLRELLGTNETVFICGGATNMIEFADWYDKIFVLIINREVAKERLMSHETASHHLPSEIERMLTDFEEKQQKLLDMGPNTAIIDGTMESKYAVDSILEEVEIYNKTP